MAGLRLIGGSDLADAIADLTGIGRKQVKGFAREGIARLSDEGRHEFSAFDATKRKAVELAVVEAFEAAAATSQPTDRTDIAVAALMGVTELTNLVLECSRIEASDWSDDDRGYFSRLTGTIATLTCHWYHVDPKARGYAVARTSGQTLVQLNEQSRTLARIEVASRRVVCEPGPGEGVVVDV